MVSGIRRLRKHFQMLVSLQCGNIFKELPLSGKVKMCKILQNTYQTKVSNLNMFL